MWPTQHGAVGGYVVGKVGGKVTVGSICWIVVLTTYLVSL